MSGAERLLCLTLTILLAGCGLLPKRTASAPHAGAAPPVASAGVAAPTGGKKAGAYYQDDGPGDNPPPNLDAIPDAAPKAEPLRMAANKPYNVFGREYVPQTALKPFRQRGVASWYGRKFNGARTSSGEIYDMYAMTAAHPTLPIPSYARVTNLANSRTVVVRVNDRGPFLSDRIMDLSYAAAYRLGYVQAGSAQVEVESVDPAKYQPAGALAKSGGPPLAAAAGATAIDAVPVKTPVVERTPETAALASAAAESAVPEVGTATAAPTRAAPALPVTADAGGIYLQLGAFSQRDNAESFRTRVYQRLDWLNDTIFVRSGDGLFRLQLGPYRDRNEALHMAQRIQDALELKPAIVVK